jgi:hypothetical protein
MGMFDDIYIKSNHVDIHVRYQILYIVNSPSILYIVNSPSILYIMNSPSILGWSIHTAGDVCIVYVLLPQDRYELLY